MQAYLLPELARPCLIAGDCDNVTRVGSGEGGKRVKVEGVVSHVHGSRSLLKAELVILKNSLNWVYSHL